MKNEIITTTGYYATGSSAVYDLLKEYDVCTEGVIGDLDVEHLMLYTPNGLFDLEDKLLIGNNLHRSDEALRSFREEMKRLNDNNFVWFGNYNKIFGPKFMTSVNELVENLTEIKFNCTWSYDYLTTKFSLKHTLSSVKNILLGKKVIGDFSKGIVYRKKDATRYSFVTPDEFYTEAKKLVNTYADLVRGDKDGKLIMDHFILPNNLFRMDNYFDNNLKVILVERDPRDAFVHVWRQSRRNGVKPRIPYEIDDFILFWKKLRASSNVPAHSNILHLQFEDLIYNYDETVKKVESFCGLQPENHVEKLKYFKPEKSIKNTQMFVGLKECEHEIKKIEKVLSEYLYNFHEK